MPNFSIATVLSTVSVRLIEERNPQIGRMVAEDIERRLFELLKPLVNGDKEPPKGASSPLADMSVTCEISDTYSFARHQICFRTQIPVDTDKVRLNSGYADSLIEEAKDVTAKFVNSDKAYYAARQMIGVAPPIHDECRCNSRTPPYSAQGARDTCPDCNKVRL